MTGERGDEGLGNAAELGRQLRREAARGRPAFSPQLQARIEQAVGEAGRDRSRRAAPWAAALSAAGCAILVVGGGLWPATGPVSPVTRPTPAVTGIDEPPPIDQLPLLDEIGAVLLNETAALTAEAVGLPRWNDLVMAGSALVAPGDDRPQPITP